MTYKQTKSAKQDCLSQFSLLNSQFPQKFNIQRLKFKIIFVSLHLVNKIKTKPNITIQVNPTL